MKQNPYYALVQTKLSSFAEVLGTAAVILIAALPTIMVFANKSPVLIISLASLFGVASATGMGAHMAGRLRKVILHHWFKVVLWLAILGWSALSIFWSLDSTVSAAKLVQVASPTILMIALIFAYPALLHSIDSSRIQLAFIAFFVVALALVSGEQQWGIVSVLKGQEFHTWEQNAAAQFLAVMVWPVLWLSSRYSYILATFIYIACVYALLKTDSQASQLIVIGGGLALILTIFFKNWIFFGFAAASAMMYLVGFFPGLLEEIVPQIIVGRTADITSSDARIAIWGAYLEGALERPLHGWGIYVSQLPSLEPFVNQLGAWASGTRHHAHNLALTLFFELGIVGVLAGAAAIVLAFRSARKASSSLQPFAYLTIYAALLNMTVGRYLWLSAWLVSLITFTALLVVFSSLPERIPFEPRFYRQMKNNDAGRRDSSNMHR